MMDRRQNDNREKELQGKRGGQSTMTERWQYDDREDKLQ